MHAARLLGLAEALRERGGNAYGTLWEERAAAMRAALATSLGPAAEAARAEGRAAEAADTLALLTQTRAATAEQPPTAN